MMLRRDLIGLLAASAALGASTRGRQAPFRGHKVYYDVAGNGPQTAVFVHGWTCDHTFWRLNAPALESKYRLVLLDLPGHGRSDKPETFHYTMELFADAVAAVMKDLGVAKATLVGHSMGVPVIQQTVRAYPGMVEGLVAVDGNFSRPPSTLEESEKRDAATRQRVERYRRADFRDAVAPAIDSMFGAKTSPEIRKDIKAKMLTAPQQVVAEAVESMGAFSKLLPPRIGVPVLAIYARRPSDSPEREAWARTFIADLDWQTWDGVAHFLMMEEPERFNRALQAFLEKVAAKSGR